VTQSRQEHVNACRMDGKLIPRTLLVLPRKSDPLGHSSPALTAQAGILSDDIFELAHADLTIVEEIPELSLSLCSSVMV